MKELEKLYVKLKKSCWRLSLLVLQLVTTLCNDATNLKILTLTNLSG